MDDGARITKYRSTQRSGDRAVGKRSGGRAVSGSTTGHAVGGSNLLQAALDEVGKQHPELSNE